MQQQWADYRVFWREFRRTFHTTGAVLPSGRALSRALTKYVRSNDGEPAFADGNARRTRRILEVGPGTGAVTSQLIHSLRPDDQVVLVERNEQFVARLRHRITNDPSFQKVADRISLVHAGVEELSEDAPFEVIVSGLPLNNFPVALVEQLLAKMRRLLAPGGTLSFFEYVAVRRAKSLVGRRADRERLKGIDRVLHNTLHGNEIGRDIVLANIPPAWVHHVKNGDWGLGTGGDVNQ